MSCDVALEFVESRSIHIHIVAKKIVQFFTFKQFGPEKCPVYLRVPWIGNPSTNVKRGVKTAVESCYDSFSIRLVFTSSSCCLWVARMFYLPLRKVLSYTNISTTVIVNALGEHLNDYKIASSNMFRNG